MPAIYSAIRAKHPDVELHVFSGMQLYDTDRPFEGPHVALQREVLAILGKLPGVQLHGNVLQQELAREYLRSTVFVYSNIVEETFCITAVEAQAAGCPVVASRNSALPETVGDAGFLIDGAPGSPEYVRSFASAVDRLLSDPALCAELGERGRARTRQLFSWQHVTDRILGGIS